jgi:hypothetical protein
MSSSQGDNRLTAQARAITRHVQAIRTSALTISRSLRQLDRPLRQLLEAGASRARTDHRARPTLSPRRRAALKLQGQYIGHIRLLKPRQKAQVRAARASKGVASAIALAKRLSRG